MNFLVGGGDYPYVPGGVLYGTAPPGTVFSNFATSGAPGDWGTGWTATGDFANAGPTTESLPGQIDPQALDTCVVELRPGGGHDHVARVHHHSDYIDFLIAGGDHPWGQQTRRRQPLINGQVVATATGDNSPDMSWVYWKVAKYAARRPHPGRRPERAATPAGVTSWWTTSSSPASRRALQPRDRH